MKHKHLFNLGMICTATTFSMLAFSGCSTTIPNTKLDAAKQSFVQPVQRTPIAPKAKVMLYGPWNSVQTLDTNGMSITTNTTYTFFDDGHCQVAIKAGETSTMSSGKWEYKDDLLTLSLKDAKGNVIPMTFKLLWYNDNQFEMRYNNLAEYEEIFKKAGVSQIKCTYDKYGVMTTLMEINSGSITMINSPNICDRKL